MVSLLLLLFLLAVPVASDTTFVFSGTLLCAAPGPFQAEITALEWDALSENEVLEYVKLRGESAVSYNFTTSEDNDGWWLDKTFELQFKFIHNCNSRSFFKNLLTFTVDVAEIPIDDGVHYINVADVDLTNRGTIWSSGSSK